jgi:hypothetical protein
MSHTRADNTQDEGKVRVYFPYLFDEVCEIDLSYTLEMVKDSPFFDSEIEKVDMTTGEKNGRAFKRAVVWFKRLVISKEHERDFMAYERCTFSCAYGLRQNYIPFMRYRETKNSHKPVEVSTPEPRKLTTTPETPTKTRRTRSVWVDAVSKKLFAEEPSWPSLEAKTQSPFKKETRGELFGNLIYGLVSSYIQMGMTAPMTPESFGKMAGRITGMFLDLEETEFKALIQNMDVFGERYQEAVEVYNTKILGKEE